MAGGRHEARNPLTGATELIESFGAIDVDLSQGGTRLQLAPGQTATIRIPLSTRSAEQPATIPLYHWDDALALWIQEGRATLQGTAATGFYCEGQVSHFTIWNADRPIAESARIQACVQSSASVAARSLCACVT